MSDDPFILYWLAGAVILGIGLGMGAIVALAIKEPVMFASLVGIVIVGLGVPYAIGQAAIKHIE